MVVTHRQSEGAVDAQVEDYLDHVLAPLVGSVPYERRKELRAELAAHLDTLVEARMELGESREEAIAVALRQFGDPAKIGSQWLGEWRPQSAFPLRSLRVAAACFLPATLLAWLAATIAGPSQTPLAVFFVLTFIPTIAGFITGVLAPSRPGSATLFSVLGIALLTAVVGWIEAFVFGRIETPISFPVSVLAAIQAAAWAPLGSIAALAGGAVRRRVLATLRAVGSV